MYFFILLHANATPPSNPSRMVVTFVTHFIDSNQRSKGGVLPVLHVV